MVLFSYYFLSYFLIFWGVYLLVQTSGPSLLFSPTLTHSTVSDIFCFIFLNLVSTSYFTPMCQLTGIATHFEHHSSAFLRSTVMCTKTYHIFSPIFHSCWPCRCGDGDKNMVLWCKTYLYLASIASLGSSYHFRRVFIKVDNDFQRSLKCFLRNSMKEDGK